MKNYYIITIFFICLLFSCKEKKVDISNFNLNIEIQRLDQDLFNEDISNLPEKYGEFLNIYTYNILRIGFFNDTSFIKNLNLFKNDEIVNTAFKEVCNQYTNIDDLNKKITNAFKYYKYYFPEKHIPKVISYIAGFNQSIVLTDSIIGIGFDKYLGQSYKIYDELGISKYLSRNMFSEKIPSDCISSWLGSEWVLDARKLNDLVSKMLYKGKIHYAVKKMLPDEADSLIFGFTQNQVKWCNNNEKNMWVHLIDQKLLFTTDNITIIKLTEDAPYTAEFTPESPGKATNWIGYKIISKYMKNNPDITLKELMDNDNYHKIFEQSKYRP